jgi:hypothetical protein
MAWVVFSALSGGNQPASTTLDAQSSNLSAMGIVACTASGTNVITLTPSLFGYTGPAYVNYVQYSFTPANSTTGATTLKVGALAALNCYKLDGTTQIGNLDLIAAQVYLATYVSTLSGGAGGFLITPLGGVSERFITLADNTTDNVSITAHGFAPKAPNDATKFLDGTGAYSVPATSGSSVVWLAKLTASSSASLVDTTHITSTYDIYKFELTNVIPATDTVQFFMRVSVDGGSTYKNTDYVCTYIDIPNNTATAFTTGYPLAGDGVTAGPLKNTALGGCNGTLTFVNPNSAAVKYCTGVLVLDDANSVGAGAYFGGGYNGVTTAVNAVQFIMSSGNIASGTINIYGVKTS